MAIDFEEDSVARLNNVQLKKISELVKLQVRLEDRRAELEEMIKDLEREIRALSQVTLPNLMAELGVSAVTTLDGVKVMLKTFVGAYIKVENEQAAFDWLRANGHGDLIKNIVVAHFGRDEDQVAVALFEELKEKGLDVSAKTSVNVNTLSAFVREQLPMGTRLPMDLLGVFERQETKIMRKKP